MDNIMYNGRAYNAKHYLSRSKFIHTVYTHMLVDDWEYAYQQHVINYLFMWRQDRKKEHALFCAASDQSMTFCHIGASVENTFLAFCENKTNLKIIYEKADLGRHGLLLHKPGFLRWRHIWTSSYPECYCLAFFNWFYISQLCHASIYLICRRVLRKYNHWKYN